MQSEQVETLITNQLDVCAAVLRDKLIPLKLLQQKYLIFSHIVFMKVMSAMQLQVTDQQFLHTASQLMVYSRGAP